jgi:hypothetical protein
VSGNFFAALWLSLELALGAPGLAVPDLEDALLIFVFFEFVVDAIKMDLSQLTTNHGLYSSKQWVLSGAQPREADIFLVIALSVYLF